jgi:hypothetical protein
MRLHHVLCVLLTLSGATSVAAADPAYVGKWKMNPSKSDFGESTIKYEQLSSDEMQATIDGQPYKFKFDEKEYPDPFGNMTIWKSLSSTSWQTTYKMKGKVVSTDTLTLSPDGKTLTIHTTGTKPNGEAIDDTIVLDRASGASGLAGQWKTKNVKSNSPSTVEITQSGKDGLTYKIVDAQLTCESKLDGKDYPCTGPTIATGWTVAFAKPAAGTAADPLEMTVKRDGKLLYKISYVVAPDGKTLTGNGVAILTNEKTKAVYDRQSGT